MDYSAGGGGSDRVDRDDASDGLDAAVHAAMARHGWDADLVPLLILQSAAAAVAAVDGEETSTRAGATTTATAWARPSPPPAAAIAVMHLVVAPANAPAELLRGGGGHSSILCHSAPLAALHTLAVLLAAVLGLIHLLGGNSAGTDALAWTSWAAVIASACLTTSAAAARFAPALLRQLATESFLWWIAMYDCILLLLVDCIVEGAIFGNVCFHV